MKHHWTAEELKRRLANARKRALYWSGNASFTGSRYSVKKHTTGSASGSYELAICDIKSLAGLLEDATGKKFKQSDPRREFQQRYAKAMEGAK